jgi:heptaprenyl diphosphate synthase
VLCAAYVGGMPLSARTARRAAIAGAAIELTHVGTLCHDDVIDDADLRRGAPSAKQQWSEPIAVIAGDYLLAQSAAMVAELGDRQCQVLADTLTAVCRGQMLEMSQQFDVGRSEEAYLDAVAGKTAGLLVGACSLGALEGGLDAANSEHLRTFGLHLGVLFQIKDDLLDLVGTAETLGKPAVQDVVNGVYTLPAIRALRESDELRALLGPAMTEAQVARFRAMVEEVGGIRYARAAVERHCRLALDALGAVQGDDDALTALAALVQAVQGERATGQAAANPAPGFSGPDGR